jgi:uncharacterized membrane protein/mono/diheme cytochrome c family protein
VSDLGIFLGRFHPLLVHFPVALLAVAAVLHLVALVTRRWRPSGAPPPYAHTAGLLLWLGALGAVASAIAGLLLATSGSYGGDTFTRHQWLGLTLAGVSLAAALVWSAGDRGTRWPGLVSGLAITCGLLLIPVGHLGANLTHGEGYLAEHAPPFLRGVLGGGEAAAAPRRTAETTRVYADLVAPVLQAQCVTCHGPAKVEGGLRLDTFEWLTKGGNDGPVLVAGQPAASEIVRRVFLPASDEDAMPPRGHRPLAPSDATLLRWWIDQGAPANATAAEVEVTPDVAPILEALLVSIGGHGPSLPAASVPAASADALDRARAAGFTLDLVADGMGYLNVHATNAHDRIDDAAVAALSAIAPQVLWLDLGQTRVTDAALTTVGKLPSLTRLRLNNTAISDAGLEHLIGLPHLESLNVYGTRVSDAGISRLERLKSLRSLYVWQTAVTADGVAKLKAAAPRLTIEVGTSDAGTR